MHGEGTSEALLEAIECCTVLRNVSEQKMADLASANVVQRKLGEKVVHSALGMSYESFVFELRDLARLLAEIQTGDTTAEKAAGRLRGIRGTVVRLADWMGSMEPQAEKFIRDPETRATALAAARAQTVNARRLAASIGRIVA